MADKYLNKRIHILGIAGTMTAPLAAALKQLGANVSGSDQDRIYPPISTYITDNDIPLNTALIDRSIDLAIIGSAYKSFQRCVDEFEQIKKLSIPYIPATEFISQNLIRPNSIVVAGSYGKTTITAALSKILTELELSPSFFFGGIAADNTPSIRLANSDWSIMEGDESINGLDTMAKFLYYPVKYLILTSTCWEHKDSYASFEDNLNAFKNLVKKLPKDGVLVYNPKDQNISSLLADCPCPAFAYQEYSFTSGLIGSHNQENLNAALTLCDKLGFDMDKCIKAASEFKGVKRRLETIYDQHNIIVLDDFAQSVDRIGSALNAVSQTFKDRPIIVFFEPHASILLKKSSLVGMQEAFNPASKVILSRLKFSPTVSKKDRVTASTWKDELGEKIIYLPDNHELISGIVGHIQPGTVLIHMSSGGKEGLEILRSVVKTLDNVYNTEK